MDCEKFDRIVLDVLYEELDELTSAAAGRHMEHCSRCRSISSALRATREVGTLPLDEPPEGLEQRIVQAEQRAHARLPLRQRAGRAVSMLAGYAMRPQLAMAALLLLMIGTSLLLLRARPGERDSVQVTERGVPEREGESVAIVPLSEKQPESDTATQAHGELRSDRSSTPAARAGRHKSQTGNEAERARPRHDEAEPTADSDGGRDAYAQALQAYQAGHYAEAQQRFEAIAEQGGPRASSAALLAARSMRGSSGCEQAASRFDEVYAAHRGTGTGHEAAWYAAECYRTMGQADRARRYYRVLTDVSRYADRAQRALANLKGSQDTEDTEPVATRKPVSKPSAAAAPAASAVEAEPSPSDETTEPASDSDAPAQ